VELSRRVSDVLTERYGVEALPCAIPGWGPAQEILWLERTGYRMKPDLIVLMFTIDNDITDIAPGSSGLPKPYLAWDPDGRVSITGFPVAEPRTFYGDYAQKIGWNPIMLFRKRTSTYAFLLARCRRNLHAAQVLSHLGLFDMDEWMKYPLPIFISAQVDPNIRVLEDLLIILPHPDLS